MMVSKKLLELTRNDNELTLIGPLFKKELYSFMDIPHIFVDGGYNFKSEILQLAPNNSLLRGTSFGDNDSSKSKLEMTLPVDKDYSDLEGILNALPGNIDRLYLFGFLGGRIDHQIVNLAAVERQSMINKSLRASFDEHILILPAGSHKLNEFGDFSLLALRECEVSIEGEAKYLLSPAKTILPMSGELISNQGNGSISLKSTAPLLLFKQKNWC